MRRLPLRVKLTLVFATAMAAVLAATGFVVYVRVGGALAAAVDHNLKAQAAESRHDLARGDGHLIDPDAAGGVMIGELVTPTGAVLDSTPAGLPALLSGSDLRRVADGATVRRTVGVPARAGDWRLLAERVHGPTGAAVLVLAGSLASREETLDRLTTEFSIAGPAALLLASALGYLLAAGALRPVESMRRRAAAVSAREPGTRLPVPPGRDELSRLAETLNEMLARLETAFERERRFAADASHELRTPLALLRTELEVALRRPRTREELQAALRSAAEETERLTLLAEDLLLIARSDNGALPIRREVVEARGLLDNVVRRFAVRAHESGRALVVTAGDEVLVDADPLRLEQALGNLVDNALAHGAGSVELTAIRNGETVELHVRDAGPGFPAAFVGRAFDRFTRVDEARGRGGTGLGLAIVDVIVRAHGGAADAANRPGGGADVWVTVPAGAQPAPDEPAAVRRSPAVS